MVSWRYMWKDLWGTRLQHHWHWGRTTHLAKLRCSVLEVPYSYCFSQLLCHFPCGCCLNNKLTVPYTVMEDIKLKKNKQQTFWVIGWWSCIGNDRIQEGVEKVDRNRNNVKLTGFTEISFKTRITDTGKGVDSIDARSAEAGTRCTIVNIWGKNCEMWNSTVKPNSKRDVQKTF